MPRIAPLGAYSGPPSEMHVEPHQNNCVYLYEFDFEPFTLYHPTYLLLADYLSYQSIFWSSHIRYTRQTFQEHRLLWTRSMSFTPVKVCSEYIQIAEYRPGIKLAG
jgi:hypothetical protein